VSGKFIDLIQEVAARRPTHHALRWDGGAMTYRALMSGAVDLAQQLERRHGFIPGQRLALSITNRPEFVIAVLAGFMLDATVAPLDVLLKEEERGDILADLRAALIVDGTRVDRLPSPAPSDPRAPALVLYTSGSTGRPKGAVLSHAALEWANRMWAGPIIGLEEADVLLAALPLAHAFGINGALFAPLLAGATVRLVERFVPERVAEIVAREPITVLPGVATMFQRLLDVPAFAGGRKLRLGVSGAAPCPWEVAEAWHARTGTRIVRGYGSTELFRPVSYLAADPAERPESIGRAVPGVELKLTDEAGTTVAGDPGELWIRTPAVMDGYLDNPDETAAVLVNGWYRTGDIARIDAEGYVTIVGRVRERIKRGGYSIFPAEVETVLLAHPAVAEAAVVAMPDPTLGEEVAAFVALRPGAAADAETLIAWCRDRLAAFKYPRRVTLIDALPRSATGKVLKAKLVV
jgi:long-chain acyl-CoA synthetase